MGNNSKEVKITKYLTKVKSLNEIKLYNNYCLAQQVSDNAQVHVKNNIIKTSPEFWKNQFLASYIDRLHIIKKTCDKLTFWTKENKTSGNCLRWVTDFDIEVDDIVWVSYPACIEYNGIVCDGIEYKLINYAELRLAKKPDGRTVLLNGWSLYEHPQESRSSILIDPNPTTDWSKGIIYMTGKKNQEYVVNDKKWVDIEKNIDIKVGDVFLKDSPANRLILEDPLFKYYEEKDLYLILRKNILAVLN